MNGFGAKAYSKVAAESGTTAGAGDPHALVLMLYDGALAAARLGLGHMQAGRVGEKAAALSKVSRIIDEGLKVSLDKSSGGQLALRLSDLYDYMTMRLLQSNLRNDAAALAEVIKLLEDLRGAWSQIRKREAASQPAPAVAAPAAAAPVTDPRAASAPPSPASPASPAARFFDATYPQPLRRVATA